MWEEFDDETAWERFYAAFQFRPGMDSTKWPAISEPPGSMTFDLHACWGDDGTAGWLLDTVNSVVVWGLAQIVDRSSQVLALDWQHPGYRFRPQLPDASSQSMHITPVPDGDYYIFLTEDFTAGTFGHPWEFTLCVFGSQLSDLVTPLLRQLLPVIRAN